MNESAWDAFSLCFLKRDIVGHVNGYGWVLMCLWHCLGSGSFLSKYSKQTRAPGVSKPADMSSYRAAMLDSG